MQRLLLFKRLPSLCTGLLLFVAVSVRGQELRIAAGVGFPLGSFGAASWQGDYGGFAGTGQQLSVSYVYRPTYGFGWSATLLGRRNPVNTRKLAGQPLSTEGWVEGQPPQTPIHYLGPWTADRDQWWTGSLLVGGQKYQQLSRDNRLSLALQAAVGIAYVRMAELKGSMKTDTMSATFTQESSTDWAFALMGGAALRYELPSGLQLLLGVRYFAIPHLHFSRVVRKTATVHGSPGDLSSNAWIQGAQTRTDQNRNMQSLDFNLGLVFQL